MNIHNTRAPLTAPLPRVHKLLHPPTHTHTLTLLYILSTSALFISSMLIQSQDCRRALGAAEALPFSFPPALSLFLDLPLSIALFLCLKGFSERPEMKGCPQWERDCRDSAGGPRCYQNRSLRVAPPYKDAHSHCPQFVHV